MSEDFERKLKAYCKLEGYTANDAGWGVKYGRKLLLSNPTLSDDELIEDSLVAVIENMPLPKN